MKISLARALTELKMTTKKIEDTFLSIDGDTRPLFVGMKRKKDEIVCSSAYNVESFNKYVQGNFDTITGLIERQRILKLAISSANNSTVVTICGKNMMISEAIFYRQTIEHKKKLAERLQKEVKKFVIENEKNEQSVDEQIKEIAKAATSSDKKGIDEDKIKNLHAIIGDPLRLELINPLDAEKKADEYLKEYEQYKTEIDFALSEINAKTEIEVAI